MTKRLDPELLTFLQPEEREELDMLLATDSELWRPTPGPQTMAFNSEADITGYGGAAGGGKTELGVGLSLTRHQRVAIFRQNGTELGAIADRIAQIVGGRTAYNGSEHIWRLRRADGAPLQIELQSFPNPLDEQKQQGRARDLMIFDEATSMRESAVRYCLGWLRTVDESQRCRALLTFNPPSTVEGRWVVQFFAPWIDPKHPNPAKPGELRWFATIDGRDTEVDGPEPFEHGGDTIVPLSRTFIPSRIADNPFLAATGYRAQLQSLPEPLRSQLLHGDFNAGVEDDEMQVCPTEWVEAAMRRWKPRDVLPPMDAVGVDVARGGKDQTIIARRHGAWFDRPLTYPGTATPDGPTVAGLVVAAVRDHAPVMIDVIGVGSSPYDFLRQTGVQVHGINVSEAATGFDKSGRLRFRNQRSELWWRMREALDPASNSGICLPPYKALLADLCAPTWKLANGAVAVASREDIIKKIGRSPDFASAFVLALMSMPKVHERARDGVSAARRDYNPFAQVRR